MPLFSKKKPKSGKNRDKEETPNGSESFKRPKSRQTSSGVFMHPVAEREDSDSPAGDSDKRGGGKGSRKQSGGKDRKVDGPKHGNSRSRAVKESLDEDDEKKPKEKKKFKIKSMQALRDQYQVVLNRVCSMPKEADEAPGTSAEKFVSPAEPVESPEPGPNKNITGLSLGKKSMGKSNRIRAKSILRTKKGKQRPATTRVRLSPETIREVDRRERAATERAAKKEKEKKDDDDDD